MAELWMLIVMVAPLVAGEIDSGEVRSGLVEFLLGTPKGVRYKREIIPKKRMVIPIR